MADSIEPAHISRMRTEQDALETKLKDLEVFLMNGDHSKLTRQQLHLLNIQSDCMVSYARVLKIRIEIDHDIWERDNAVEPNEPVVGATTENTDAITGES